MERVRSALADGDVTLDAYHWLAERVEYDPTMQRRFSMFAKRQEFRDSYNLDIMRAFADHRGGAGIYGDGQPMTVNTYNGDDLLSQTLQYVYWTESDGQEEYVLLQVHGGCDVRGGYTNPKVFRVSVKDYSILDNARAVIWEQTDPGNAATPDLFEGRRNPQNWSTDDACHWYPDGCCGRNYRQLETYPVSEDPEHRGDGEHIFLSADGLAYGPQGGLLSVSS